MKIYFVRHGQTESNKKGIKSGHVDTPLTDEGIEQARKMSLEIPLDFSEMYSSDLIRCTRTAEILNEKLHTSIIYDPRLRERNFGSFAGKTWEEIGQNLKKIDTDQKYNYRPYGGESVDDVEKRVMSFIDDIRRIKTKGKILVVTSAGVIRLLHHMLHGKIPEKIHNSSIHEFEFKD